MRPRDLDLESQGQGHTKVTRVKTLQKVRFSPDCEHAECAVVLLYSVQQNRAFSTVSVDLYRALHAYSTCIHYCNSADVLFRTILLCRVLLYGVLLYSVLLQCSVLLYPVVYRPNVLFHSIG